MKRLSLFVAAVLAACGDGPTHYSGQTDVTGVGATPFTAVEANAIIVSNACAGGVGKALLRLALVDRPGFCARASAGRTAAGMGGLSLVLQISTSTGGVPGIPVGTYTLPTSSVSGPNDEIYASAAVLRLDSECSLAADQEPVTGQVMILSSSTMPLPSPYAHGVSGTVDVTTPDGTRVTGSFSAPGCDITSGDLCGSFFRIGPDITTCLP